MFWSGSDILLHYLADNPSQKLVIISILAIFTRDECIISSKWTATQGCPLKTYWPIEAMGKYALLPTWNKNTWCTGQTRQVLDQTKVTTHPREQNAQLERKRLHPLPYNWAQDPGQKVGAPAALLPQPHTHPTQILPCMEGLSRTVRFYLKLSGLKPATCPVWLGHWLRDGTLSLIKSVLQNCIIKL